MKKVSIRDIAAAAGVSKTTAGEALQNLPRVQPQTRVRIHRIAKRLGYVPDKRMASWMASVRGAKSKRMLPLAWLNTNTVEGVWRKYKFMWPYLEGAIEGARRLGYSVEEFWLYKPGLTLPGLVAEIHQKGIEGIIFTFDIKHLRIDLTNLAGVTIQNCLLAPRLHWVQPDIYRNVLLAIQKLISYGYRRIGICLSDYFDRGAARASRAAGYYCQATYPELSKIPPLFYVGENDIDWPKAKVEIADWVARYGPDAVVCHTNRIVPCIESAGFRVPQDIGVLHLATDDDVPDWAGINSQKREIGAMAVETLVSLIHSRQFGVPEVARGTTIRGTWHPGSTLLMPKPR